MAGYTRVDTSNNIADGNIISASDLDNEFDGIQAAFNASTGHNHDGTTGEGAPILVLGPTQDVVVGASTVTPKTTNTVDIGSSSLKFKDLYLSGNASVGGTLAVTGVATLTAQPVLSSLTANQAVFTDSSKGLVSNAITGTGNVVMSNSPTLVTPSLGTPSALVGTNITGTASGLSIGGNAATATTLQTARTINGVSFNGSANITVTANTTNTLTLGSYLTGTSFNGSSAVTAAVDATNANTASKIVARDSSGNFSAGTITAALSGNATTATTATNATNVTVTTSATASAFKVPFANTTASTTGNYGLLQDSAAEFTYNPSTNTLTVGTVSGALSGNATTATTLATARTIQTNLASTSSASFNGSANITPGVTGTLPVANGGTGRTSYTASRLVYSSGTTTLASTTTLTTDGANLSVGSYLYVTAQLYANSALYEQYTDYGSGSAITPNNSNYIRLAPTGSTTYTFAAAPTGPAYAIIVRIVNGGSYSITWGFSPKWPGGTAPTLSASGTDILGFYTDDQGTTWYGFTLGLAVA